MTSSAPLKASSVKQSLKELADPERAKMSLRFFKTGPGQYGEGDTFWGISVPNQRNVAKQFDKLPLEQIDKLLRDPIHECRLTALLILVGQFKKLKDQPSRKTYCNFVLDRTAFINNWDLVDSSAPQIIGVYLLGERDRKLLNKLAKSKSLWEQRIAVVANQTLIKNGQFDCILTIAADLLSHPHDLIHKAVGWMLREVGDHDESVLRGFLDTYAVGMPRTMLRYAIEKFPPSDRKKYLSA